MLSPEPDAAGRSQAGGLVRLVDERDPYGGAAKAALFLVHPGPSLLVTAVTLATAALALRGTPPAMTALQLILVMLPAQFAIGAANDLADRDADRAAKPYKPLARGAVSERAARAIAVGGSLTCLASAASLGPTPLVIAAVGLGAGLGYDLRLKPTPVSWLAWWVGFAALSLGAWAAVNRLTPGLWWAIPVTGLLALALHCVNALPDIGGDREAGLRSLPVLLGTRWTRAVLASSSIGVAVFVVLLHRPLHQSGPWVAAAAGLFAACGTAAATVMPRQGARTAFPLMAAVAAALAVAWMAALPAG